MNPDLETLGKRAVACPRWRWMPGMAAIYEANHSLTDKHSGMAVQVTEIRLVAEAFVICEPEHRFAEVSILLNGKTRSYGSLFTKDLTPDLSDPATVGCLLALVREAWPSNGMESVSAHHSHAQKWLIDLPGKVICGDTEAEALVAALEAAP